MNWETCFSKINNNKKKMNWETLWKLILVFQNDVIFCINVVQFWSAKITIQVYLTLQKSRNIDSVQTQF